jgi:plasmid stabilization system protein ParE
VTHSISVSRQAGKDAERLDQRLMEYDPAIAARFGDLLEQTILSLAEYPSRGRSIGPTTREVNIPFGQSAYIVRYRVSASRVTITRIWHGLEDRKIFSL